MQRTPQAVIIQAIISMLDFKGFPDKMVYTARSLGWMCAGHHIHHTNILLEKYLTER